MALTCDRCDSRSNVACVLLEMKPGQGRGAKFTTVVGEADLCGTCRDVLRKAVESVIEAPITSTPAAKAPASTAAPDVAAAPPSPIVPLVEELPGPPSPARKRKQPAASERQGL